MNDWSDANYFFISCKISLYKIKEREISYKRFADILALKNKSFFMLIHVLFILLRNFLKIVLYDTI